MFWSPYVPSLDIIIWELTIAATLGLSLPNFIILLKILGRMGEDE